MEENNAYWVTRRDFTYEEMGKQGSGRGKITLKVKGGRESMNHMLNSKRKPGNLEGKAVVKGSLEVRWILVDILYSLI